MTEDHDPRTRANGGAHLERAAFMLEPHGSVVGVLRIVYVAAALLAMAAGALVTASLFVAAHAPHGTRFLGISLLVSAVFVGTGLVLLGIQRHVAAVAAAARDHGADSLPAVARHVGRLAAHLLAAGLLACLLLAALTYGILERMAQGSAVFG